MWSHQVGMAHARFACIGMIEPPFKIPGYAPNTAWIWFGNYYRLQAYILEIQEVINVGDFSFHVHIASSLYLSCHCMLQTTVWRGIVIIATPTIHYLLHATLSLCTSCCSGSAIALHQEYAYIYFIMEWVPVSNSAEVRCWECPLIESNVLHWNCS